MLNTDSKKKDKKVVGCWLMMVLRNQRERTKREENL
jgi:hypothetical protein